MTNILFENVLYQSASAVGPSAVKSTPAIRAGQIVNVVLDFGADPTAVGDSTAAIQAALNSAYGMAQFTGVISGAGGTLLTASSVVGTLSVGMLLSFSGITANNSVTIASLGTGTGGAGTYNLTNTAGLTFTSRSMMACVGQSSFARKKVFLPAGNYRTTAPLYILGVLGAHVYGAGNGATQIFFNGGSASQGNILDNAGFGGNSTWTPVIALDGVAYSKFEMFDIGSPATNNETNSFVGIMAYQSGPLGTTSSIMFENMNITNFWTGIVGVQGGGNVENCSLYNIQFNSCGMNGLNLTNQNVLNWQVYGGGAQQCSWLSTYVFGAGTGTIGAAYNSGSGSIGVISGVSCTGNVIDIAAAGQQCAVLGGSSEGGPAFAGTLGWAGGTATFTTVNSIPHRMTGTPSIIIYGAAHSGYNGYFTGTVTGTTTIQYSITNPGSPTDTAIMALQNSASIVCKGPMSVDGYFFRGGSSAYVLPFYCEGGLMVANGCALNPSSDGGFGYIFWLSESKLQLNGTVIGQYGSSSFKSTGSSTELWMKGTTYIGAPTSPFSAFSNGRVRDYDKIYETTVSGLPTAAAIFTGLRGIVTDLNIARSFGGSVVTHGGGSTLCPVICTGADWIMG